MKVFATVEFDIDCLTGQEDQLGNVVRRMLNQMDSSKENIRHGYNIYIQSVHNKYIIDEKGKIL